MKRSVCKKNEQEAYNYSLLLKRTNGEDTRHSKT
jgi:hypothetical protein